MKNKMNKSLNHEENIKKLRDLRGLRGSIILSAPLGAESWFGCGGAADVLLEPADVGDLIGFLSSPPLPSPPPNGGREEARSVSGGRAHEITIIGGLANTIIRDGGIRGITIRLGRPFAQIKTLNEIYIEAGAGALNGSVAAAAMKAGIGGLEFLSGIPGTIGGAIAMNAGAYGTEMKDVLIGINAVTTTGETWRLTAPDLKMSYRHTEIPDGTIFTSAILKGTRSDYDTVRARLNEIKTKRNETQPIREKTGGSTFANPSPEELRRANLPEDTRAWKVVELIGGRGLMIGGAQMSEKHCNFMINTGDATAAHLEMLGEEIRRRAFEKFGINLRWEIKFIGEHP
jgi:UDP-N-acetylmuramate dehydrogenase